MRLVKLCAALSLTGFLFGCSDEVIVEPNPLPVVAETKVNYDIQWSLQFGQGSDSQFVKLVPQYGYSNLYVADVAGTITAISPDSGEVVWKSDTNKKISAGVAVGNRMVVVGTREGQVLAFDAETGKEKWAARVSSEVIASPAVGDGFVVVNSVDGKITAFDAESGEQKWFYDRNLPPLTLRGTSAPVITSGAAIAGFANGKVGVFILNNGQLAWEKQITAPRGKSDLERLVDVDAKPVVFGTTLYVSSYNGNLMALELRSSEPRWSRELSSFQDLTIDNQTLLVTQDNGHVTSLNRNNGALLWTQKALFLRKTTAPQVFGNHIVVGDMSGYLHMLNKADGKLIGQLNVNRHLSFDDCYDLEFVCRFHNHEQFGIASAPLVVKDKLIVQTQNGQLIAYKQRKDS
ncbi:MAG: outer membrane protein assembly factor BamB [Kangiellaceae bacterium]|jgi:outer membrane protein assembly factor BamB|nr:outer membrane protein assembly factor BamB [Kangiellaceae bacterium]